MEMKRILETARLMLREMTPDDFDALYAVLADSDIMQHYPYTFDEARVRGWIERNIARYQKDGFGLWAVILKETGEMIGDCGLTLQNIEGEMLPEIGYHIRRDCQRKGYAGEAGRAVRDWAFEQKGFDRVYSYMKYTNVPSYSTAMAMGMKKIRQYPDPQNGITFVFGMSREEWQQMKGRPGTGAPMR
ncbi:MAG: GNAT family N-acetyltransferase [Candidatus Ventricola sp.]